MTKIESYVFFDLETTGLPHLERNKTKITELCFLAVLRSELENASNVIDVVTNKLCLLFNPKKKITARAAEMTGLTNKLLKKSPTFKEQTNTILQFLQELPKPVCLVAHNGDIFDYKILLAEFEDVSVKIPADLLCVDSLKAFKSILNNDANKCHSNSSTIMNDSLTNSSKIMNESLTSNDEWSELDISVEDWDNIDSICLSLTEAPPAEPRTPLKQANGRYGDNLKMEDYKLTTLYRKLLNKEVVNAHRAEGDCIMLLECVAAVKEFLPWVDANFKYLCSIAPLDRKKYAK